ncbi:hypothetical protein [Lysobacter capsici]|uniref:hypothetical protein n=1 Tax=Lysobacter capsici TaxID=435897 RepID=UPI00062809F0|nr:hypothetical protein [Lysobacter capsici]
MSIADKIPWQKLALTAAECGELWGITPEHFLAAVACKPTSPVRLTRKWAEAVGRGESTYRAKCRPVYEWLLSEPRDAEREAARALVKAVGVRD